MPPKRKRTAKEETDGGITSKPARKKPRAAPKGGSREARKMPRPLPAGELFTDLVKKQWVLGPSVGKGGFGEIYLATQKGQSTAAKSAPFVIKVVSHEIRMMHLLHDIVLHDSLLF